jgi:CRP/FNR family transcriptional regulator
MTNGQVINSCTVGKNQLCCFDQLSEEQLAYIDANSVQVTYSKGETICKQGTFAPHIIMIKEGLAKIYLEGKGETLILKISPAVNLIGLTSLIEGNHVFQYSAQAYMDTTVKLIDINIFKEMLRKNGKFATEILGLLSENTIITYGRFFCLTKKQTYGRLADVILCLSNRVYKSDTFPLHLTRKELAELASMSVESIARILTKFKDDKLIKIESDTLEILDVERLSMISQNG